MHIARAYGTSTTTNSRRSYAPAKDPRCSSLTFTLNSLSASATGWSISFSLSVGLFQFSWRWPGARSRGHDGHSALGGRGGGADGDGGHMGELAVGGRPLTSDSRRRRLSEARCAALLDSRSNCDRAILNDSTDRGDRKRGNAPEKRKKKSQRSV